MAGDSLSRTRRRGGRRRLAVVGCLAAAGMLAAGCGSAASSAASSGSSAEPTVTIVYGAPIADHMIPAVAQAAGLFAKFGVKVKIEYLQASELMPALVSEQAQFVSIPAPGPEIAALSGQPIVEVAQWEDDYDTLLISAPKYPTLASLNGATISIDTPGDFPTLLTEIAEARSHTTMQQVPLGAPPTQITAFEAGHVDAIAAFSPYELSAVQAKVPGAHVLLDWRTVKNVPGLQLVGYQPWLSSHRSTVVKVLEAINAGLAYFRDKAHEAQAVSVITKVTGTPEAISKAAYLDVLQALSPTIVPSVSSQKAVLPYLVSSYPSAKTFDASKLVDTSYVDAALKQ